jgi:hypothetical protein
VLDSPFCYVPTDVIVPGALAVGDLPDIVSALAPIPLRLEAQNDGRNRIIAPADADRSIESPGADVARWIATSLREV